MKNYVQDGDYIEITAAATIVSGEIVQVGDLHGVAVTDIANGAKGNLATEGVFRLDKATGAAGDACTLGGNVYFKSKKASGDSSGTKKIGYALEAANQAATTVLVRLSV
jgi:predicted RecA/RadA family phage recombinase